MDFDQTTRDAQRYRLLRDYLLSNGFVAYQNIQDGHVAFVLDADFYGPTFEDAVDSLEEFAESQSLDALQRGVIYEMPKREEGILADAGDPPDV